MLGRRRLESARERADKVTDRVGMVRCLGMRRRTNSATSARTQATIIAAAKMTKPVTAGMRSRSRVMTAAASAHHDIACVPAMRLATREATMGP
jgi:hypothetical protein